MDNNISDKNYLSENQEKILDNDQLEAPASEDDASKYCNEYLKTSFELEIIQNHDLIKGNVAEKVEGGISYPTDIGDEAEFEVDKHSIAVDNLENLKDAEDLVRDWEVNHKDISLSKKARNLALLAASLHIHEKRGITVKDLRRWGLNKDSSERRLQIAKDKGLFIPHGVRIGKQKQYILSNYKYILDPYINSRKKNSEYEITPEMLDKDLVVQLLRALSSRRYTFHHIYMQTNLLYKEDYNNIRWKIVSSANNQKVATFKLTQRRKCTFTISPTGTVAIVLECTLDPYIFHRSSGIAEFFGSCGQALQILKDATLDRFAVVPSISEWYLVQFEYNKDMSTEDPVIASWAPINGRLKIEYLGALFQIYPKGLPDVESILRTEAKNTQKKRMKVVDVLSNIIENDKKDSVKTAGKISPFVTAEEMYEKILEKSDSQF